MKDSNDSDLEFNDKKQPDEAKDKLFLKHRYVTNLREIEDIMNDNMEPFDSKHRKSISYKNYEMKADKEKSSRFQMEYNDIKKQLFELERKLSKENKYYEEMLKQKEKKYNALEKYFSDTKAKYRQEIRILDEKSKEKEEEIIRMTAENHKNKNNVKLLESKVNAAEISLKLKEEEKNVLKAEIESMIKEYGDKEKKTEEITESKIIEIESLTEENGRLKNSIKEMQEKIKTAQRNVLLESAKNINEKKDMTAKISADKELFVHPLAKGMGESISLDELIFGIAHQLRNPLGIIQSNIQSCIKKNSLDEMTKRQMKIVLKNAASIAEKLDKFLEFTKHMKLSLQEVSMSELISNLKYVIDERSKKQNVSLLEDISSDLPVIAVDSQRIKEALLNVLINSLDALPNGGAISISALYIKEKNEIAVEIADNGKGIAGIHKDQIFMPFFTTKEDKMGIGLSYTRQIISAHNGTIKVESKEGKGTTVIISLPVNLKIESDKEQANE